LVRDNNVLAFKGTVASNIRSLIPHRLSVPCFPSLLHRPPPLATIPTNTVHSFRVLLA
jgi:hypothetical protein